MVRVGDVLGAAATVGLGGTKVVRLSARTDNDIPALKVLYTSDAGEAQDFLDRYLDSSTLGLDLTWKAHEKGEPYSRSSLLQIASNRSVLLFDLLPKPESGRPPKQLSEKMCGFLQMSNRTFYDIAMPIHAARMAFELNCVIPRGVDLAFEAGAWPERHTKADNIISLGNRVLKTKAYLMSPIERALLEERPLTGEQLRYAAERAYLSWAVAERFLSKEGPADKKAFVTKTDIYAAGELLRAQGLPERKTRFDWSRVKAAFLKKQKASAKKNAQDESSKSSPARRQRENSSPAKTVGSGEVAVAANEFAVLKRLEAARKRRAAEKAEAEAAAAAAEEVAERKKMKANKEASRKKQRAAKKADAGDAAAAAAEREAPTKKKTTKPESSSRTRAKVAKKGGAAPVAAEEFAALKKRDAARKRRAAEKAEAEAKAAAAVAKQEAEREERREAAKAAKAQQRLLRQKNLASRKATKAARELSEPLARGRRATAATAVSGKATRKSGKKVGRKVATSA